MFTRRSLSLLLACGLLVTAGGAFARGGDDDDDRDEGKVEGTLTAVNASATPPTITINGTTLLVTSETKIEIDDRHAAFADLVVGERTEAEFDRESLVAIKVEQEADDDNDDDDDNGGGGNRPGKVEATLTAVDAGATPPTVTIGAVTLNVLPTTKIEISERHVALSALVVGDRTEALYDPATLNASKIEQGDDDNDDDENEDNHITGTVLVGEPSTGNVTFDVDGDGIEDLTLKTDANTEIEIGSAHIGPSELALLNGLPALIEYFPATLYAKEIKARADAPTNVAGTAAAVDAANRTLQVATRTGSRTLLVPTGADIRSGKKKIKLTSIRAGAKITAKTTTNSAGQEIAVRITVTGKRPNRSNGATVERRGRGADDGPGHVRHGRGSDDGPGHVRHGRGEDDGVHHHRRRGRNS